MAKYNAYDLADYLRKLADEIESKQPEVLDMSFGTGEREITQDTDAVRRYESTGERWVKLRFVYPEKTP